ncbi:MAG: hypothetical protein H2212_15095 [Ruminococcus sp.]|nr:hypothetical protein [Ruminococcus sp.]
MGIKGILGFCECKGCHKRMQFEMDIIAHLSTGDKKVKTRRLCSEHAQEAMRGGELKSVTFEHTVDLDD